MKIWVTTDGTGRIISAVTLEKCAVGMTEVELSDGMTLEDLGDYRYLDGELSYTGEATEAAIAAEKEAKAAALRASQLKTAAVMYIRSSASTLTDSQAASVSLLFDDWCVDVDYKQGDTRRYDDKLWRCSQAHKSQVGWEPGVAPSLWYEIMIAPDGILVWKEPGGAHNAYNYGDKVHYPDADGAIYVSKRDGNISVPGTDEWWVPEDAE